MPTDQLAATIELLDTQISPGDELRYKINNTGSLDLICGLPYRLERETTGGWVPMNPEMAFRAIGFGVLPGESRELTATIPVEGLPALTASARR